MSNIRCNACHLSVITNALTENNETSRGDDAPREDKSEHDGQYQLHLTFLHYHRAVRLFR